MNPKTGSPQNNLRIVLILASLYLLMAGYYIIHSPFTLETGAVIGMSLWRLVVAAIIMTIAGTIGRLTGVLVQGNELATVVIQAGMGLGILSIYILLAGSIVGINGLTMAIIPAALLVVLRKNMVAWLRSFGRSLTGIWLETGRFEKGIAAFVLVILLTSLLSALAPPIKYDALMYHLVMPQTYIQQGRISHIPWLVMTGMPQATEMMYTLSAWVGGLPAAAVSGWMVGCLALLGLISFFQNASELNVRRIGWVAAASLLAGETFATSLSWAYVDWMGLFFGVCCLICFRDWYVFR